jgi:hypothetical protein
MYWALIFAYLNRKYLVVCDARSKNDPGGGNLSVIKADFGEGCTVENVIMFH